MTTKKKSRKVVRSKKQRRKKTKRYAWIEMGGSPHYGTASKKDVKAITDVWDSLCRRGVIV